MLICVRFDSRHLLTKLIVWRRAGKSKLARRLPGSGRIKLPRRWPRAAANRVIISRLKAEMSSGLRLVRQIAVDDRFLLDDFGAGVSQIVVMEDQEVIRRPRAWSASTTIHGPWQIAATGLPASKNAFTRATATGTILSLSGLITPPSSSRASKSRALASLSFRSTGRALRRPWGDNLRRSASLIERLARFGQFHLLETVGDENGNPQTLQGLVGHDRCSFRQGLR